MIAGGGLAAQRCAETLRRVGYDGDVRIVCGEPHRPYDRPPLSKEVLLDADADEGVPLRAADWYEGKRVELLLGARASGFDADASRLRLEDGRELDYEHLVVATGRQAAPAAGVRAATGTSARSARSRTRSGCGRSSRRALAS